MMISKAAKRSHNIFWQRVIEELTEKCRSQEGQMEQVEDEIDGDGNDGNNDKVNRCLARYSPCATATNQPTNRAPNELAKPGPK